jgi:hypothetical protein
MRTVIAGQRPQGRVPDECLHSQAPLGAWASEGSKLAASMPAQRIAPSVDWL